MSARYPVASVNHTCYSCHESIMIGQFYRLDEGGKRTCMDCDITRGIFLLLFGLLPPAPNTTERP